MYPQLDRTDLSILKQIMEPTKTPPTRKELAEKIKSPTHPDGHIAEHTLSIHIEKLEKAEVITGYHVSVDPEKIGLSFLTFAHVRLEKYSKADLVTFRDAMRKSPYVLECYGVSDRENDYLLKLATPTRQKYHETMQDFLDLPGVTRYITLVILDEVKRTGMLSLDHLHDAPLTLHHRNGAAEGAAETAHGLPQPAVPGTMPPPAEFHPA